MPHLRLAALLHTISTDFRITIICVDNTEPSDRAMADDTGKSDFVTLAVESVQCTLWEGSLYHSCMLVYPSPVIRKMGKFLIDLSKLIVE
jgi:hypothetical protein